MKCALGATLCANGLSAQAETPLDTQRPGEPRKQAIVQDGAGFVITLARPSMDSRPDGAGELIAIGGHVRFARPVIASIAPRYRKDVPHEQD